MVGYDFFEVGLVLTKTTCLVACEHLKLVLERVRQPAAERLAAAQHTSAYVSIRQHTSVYGSIRQHTAASAYVRILTFLQQVSLLASAHRNNLVIA
jgi:hypothetical protein